ncbi:MAG: MbnP family protein [Flavobacteriales bacterium]
MKNWSKLLLILALSLALFSCEDDETEECVAAPTSKVLVKFIPQWNGEPVEDGAEYQDHYGNELLQFNFKAFISNLKLIGETGEADLSEIELLALGDGMVELEFDVPAGENYTSLLFHTGVPPEYNVDYDPSSWSNSHPLSVQGAQGMHWSWNTGYIFTKFDGKADTLGTTSPGYLYPFSFHAGADEFYTPHDYPLNIATLENDTSTITFTLAMETLLNSAHDIDIREDGETHTGGDFDLAQQFTDNFNACFSLE